MDTALLSLALTAGAVAALNPCGFALLPAYLGLMLRESDPALTGTVSAATPSGALRSVRRALGLTAVMTAGFLVVFLVFGLLVAPVAASVQQYLPWVTTVTGVGLVVLGAFLLAGRQISLPSLRLGSRSVTGGAVSTFLYGITYALASLTCTVAPFLAVVVTSLRSADFLEGLLLFGAYAAGMGLVVGIAAVAVSLARAGAVGSLRRSSRLVPLAAGSLVLLVGLYVTYYGIWEIRVLEGADPADPVIDRALELQAWLSERVRDLLAPIT